MAEYAYAYNETDDGPAPPPAWWDGLASEPALVALAKSGSADAYGELIARYQVRIHAFIARTMRDADDADDLTQDTFARAFRAIAGTGADLNLSAWLHRVAHNLCIDVMRRRQRMRFLSWNPVTHDQLMLGAPADDPEFAAIGHETRATVQTVLDRMGHRHRTGLVLREFEGMSCEEIGEVMGLSRSAVKSMLFRARQEFRVVYAKAEKERAGHRKGVGSRVLWTAAEEATFLRLLAAGWTNRQIAVEVGRTLLATKHKGRELRRAAAAVAG